MKNKKKADQVYGKIVSAAGRLLFGDAGPDEAVVERTVRAALKGEGVEDEYYSLFEDGDDVYG